MSDVLDRLKAALADRHRWCQVLVRSSVDGTNFTLHTLRSA
jgi:hypothetical protein